MWLRGQPQLGPPYTKTHQVFILKQPRHNAKVRGALRRIVPQILVLLGPHLAILGSVMPDFDVDQACCSKANNKVCRGS